MEAATAAPPQVTLREKLGVTTPQQAITYLNILYYGDPGVGKTRLASTAQDHEATAPMLFLDIDGGITTIRNRADIDVKSPRSIKEVVDIINMLYNDTTGYYKTLAIDSLTELQKKDMVEVMEVEYGRNPENTDKDVPTQRAWGKSSERIRRIVRAARDLPMNTIMTAHAHELRDKEGNLVGIYPSLPGKLRIEVSGFMDCVGYMFTNDSGGQVKRQLQFAKTRRVLAKDRTDKLGDLIESPSIPLLWEKIHTED